MSPPQQTVPEGCQKSLIHFTMCIYTYIYTHTSTSSTGEILLEEEGKSNYSIALNNNKGSKILHPIQVSTCVPVNTKVGYCSTEPQQNSSALSTLCQCFCILCFLKKKCKRKKWEKEDNTLVIQGRRKKKKKEEEKHSEKMMLP